MYKCLLRGHTTDKKDVVEKEEISNRNEVRIQKDDRVQDTEKGILFHATEKEGRQGPKMTYHLGGKCADVAFFFDYLCGIEVKFVCRES